MTQREMIIAELNKMNISTTGLYATLPNIIEDLIDSINTFGLGYVEKSTLGQPMKELAIRLSNLAS